MTKRLAAAAAFGLCALPAAMAQQPQQPPTPAQPPPTQQAPTPTQQTQPPTQPAQPTQQTPQAPPQAPARPGYYQFPQPAPPPAPATPQYPKYYEYPQNPPPPPPPQYVAAKPVHTEPLVHWHIDGGWSDPAGRTSDYLRDGYSVGLGFSVAPARGSPLDLRFDVDYDRNDATSRLIGLNQNSSDSINRGREEIWSGTLDLEMHLPLGGGAALYFFGGGGAYNMTLTFGEPFNALGGYYGGYYCDPFQGFCGGGGFGEVRAGSHTLTKFGWNAGAGLQGPLGPAVKWFLEGRYNRVQEPNGAVPLAFIPVTVGLRF